jgi:hypothetical protein
MRPESVEGRLGFGRWAAAPMANSQNRPRDHRRRSASSVGSLMLHSLGGDFEKSFNCRTFHSPDSRGCSRFWALSPEGA